MLAVEDHVRLDHFTGFRIGEGHRQCQIVLVAGQRDWAVHHLALAVRDLREFSAAGRVEIQIR